MRSRHARRRDHTDRSPDANGPIAGSRAGRLRPATACRRSAASPRPWACRRPPWSRPTIASRPRVSSAPGAGPASTSPAPTCRRWRSPTWDRPRERDIDPFWVSKQSLDADASILKPGCGWLPADWMPNAALRKAPANSEPGQTMSCCPTTAVRAARWRCAACCSAGSPRRASTATAEQILLTGSGTQAIDLICRLLLRPGDAVLVDDPCYFNFQALLRAHQVRMIGVPFTPTGPDISAFEQALATTTSSSLHHQLRAP